MSSSSLRGDSRDGGGDGSSGTIVAVNGAETDSADAGERCEGLPNPVSSCSSGDFGRRSGLVITASMLRNCCESLSRSGDMVANRARAFWLRGDIIVAGSSNCCTALPRWTGRCGDADTGCAFSSVLKQHSSKRRSNWPHKTGVKTREIQRTAVPVRRWAVFHQRQIAMTVDTLLIHCRSRPQSRRRETASTTPPAPVQP